jgi:hypothetical protein
MTWQVRSLGSAHCSSPSPSCSPARHATPHPSPLTPHPPTSLIWQASWSMHPNLHGTPPLSLFGRPHGARTPPMASSVGCSRPPSSCSSSSSSSARWAYAHPMGPHPHTPWDSLLLQLLIFIVGEMGVRTPHGTPPSHPMGLPPAAAPHLHRRRDGRTHTPMGPHPLIPPHGTPLPPPAHRIHRRRDGRSHTRAPIILPSSLLPTSRRPLPPCCPLHVHVQVTIIHHPSPPPPKQATINCSGPALL